MNINEFHEAIRTYLNPGQGRYWPPEAIDTAINNSIRDLFRQEYAQFEVTQNVTDTLGYFKKPVTLGVENGYVTLPPDLFHVSGLEAVMSDGSLRSMEEIQDGMWNDRKSSPSVPPSPLYPICRQRGTSQLEVLPIAQTGVVGVFQVNLLYLRKPAYAIFAYTDASGYGFNYLPAGSVNPDWPEVDHERIMLKALGYLGIPTANATDLQAEQLKKQSNNGQ